MDGLVSMVDGAWSAEHAGVVAPAARVGIVGAGAFGSHHAGKVAGAPDAALIGVYDPVAAQAQALCDRVGGRAFDTLDAMLAGCDAVIVASPASTHAEVATRALCAGKHVLVEKPLATAAHDADRLVRLARAQGLVLQAGHQERFVMEALGLLDLPRTPLLLDCVREGPPTGRGLDVSVTLDLMVHDLDFVAATFGVSPLRVAAVGLGEAGRLDAVEVRLVYAHGEARLRASRIAQARRRTLRADFAEGAVEVDFVTRRLRNDAGLALNADFAERCPDPLGASLRAFLDAIARRGPCRAPGEAGAAAVRLAEMVDAAASLAVAA